MLYYAIKSKSCTSIRLSQTCEPAGEHVFLFQSQLSTWSKSPDLLCFLQEPRWCGPGRASHACFTLVSLQSLSGLIYTSHMDVIRPPVCMNLHFDWGRKKKKTLGISSDWHLIRCQGSRWRKSEVTHMADLHHMASKRNQWNWWSDFFILYIFSPLCSLYWPLTSITRLVFVQQFLYN